MTEDVSVTMDECIAYFARAMNAVKEGDKPYTSKEIRKCWNTMHPAERAEWEDETLAAKMED